MDTDSDEDVYAQMHRLMEQEQQQGHTPYFIPVGGSVPLGSLGYVNCAHEIAQQCHDEIEGQFPQVKHCMVHVSPDPEIAAKDDTKTNIFCPIGSNRITGES